MILFSCANRTPSPRVTYALEKAGENRKELEKVLKKYSRFKKDSLKYEAASYLIANMPGHYGIYHNNNEAVDAVYEKIEHTLVHGFDSAETALKQNNPKYKVKNNAYKEYDLDVITSDYLIRNIENAFMVWEEYPWCQDMSFERFKTYILPYRIGTEPLYDLRAHFQQRFTWLKDSLKENPDMEKAFELVNRHFLYSPDNNKGWRYGNVQNLNDIVRVNGGACDHETFLKNYIKRSLGIVCTFDEIPQWANRAQNHSWTAYIRSNGNSLYIKGPRELKDFGYVHSALFKVAHPKDSLIPDDILVYPYKKAPKVFRRTFQPNRNSLYFQHPSTKKIPPKINDIFKKDITDSYMECYDIKINLFKNINHSFAYICVYDRGNIIPVDWGKVKNELAHFKKIGSDILYIATVYHENQLYIASNPFVVQEDGKIRYITHRKKTNRIKLKRKYPLFGNILNYANKMYGGKFQACNEADFKDVTNLYHINHTPLLPTEVTVNVKESFRYLRYMPRSNSRGDIGDITFYYDSAGTLKPVSGEPIYKYEGALESPVRHAFDGKASTYYRSHTGGAWIGLDLGAGNAKRIKKIIFNPRTDTNYIIPENEYELFYWSNGWKSLGKKVAQGYSLEFDKAPKDALFWLYCHSGGQEERPFTYKDGKQVWW